MYSHCDGECWGLEVCKLEDGSYRVVTTADDNRILAVNPQSRQVCCQGKINVAVKKEKKKGGKKGKKAAETGFKGGASSMSSQPSENQSRCVAYNPKQSVLAVADNTGIVTIREVDWAAVDAGKEGSLDVIKHTLFEKIDKKKREWIEAMVFSPCGKYLAVGSHDNFIYLMNASKSYKQIIKFTGHSSFVTSIDWSQDSKFLRTVCGAYELLFFNVEDKKRDPSGASNTVETMWSDQTCKLGWAVQGIFPAGCDGSHVNSVSQNRKLNLIATGDDWGQVNLYRYPVLEKSAPPKPKKGEKKSKK